MQRPPGANLGLRMYSTIVRPTTGGRSRSSLLVRGRSRAPTMRQIRPADHDQHIADAEHVGERPPGRDVEDVAEHGEVRIDSADEFSNTSGGISRRPALRQAVMLAGIVPPLAEIASRLHRRSRRR